MVIHFVFVPWIVLWSMDPKYIHSYEILQDPTEIGPKGVVKQALSQVSDSTETLGTHLAESFLTSKIRE
jgi:hypothetical protein